MISFSEPHGFSEENQILVLIACVLVGLSAIVIAFLYSSRILKTIRQQKELSLRNDFQKAINGIVMMETTSHVPDSAYYYYLSALRKRISRSAYSKQIMVNQLLSLKKNFSGASARSVDQIFITLRLSVFCIGKLKWGTWMKKAKAIHELAEMNYQPAFKTIRKYLGDSNPVVRQEAFMALTQANKNDPFFFLDQYTKPLTPWMKINIHHRLMRFDKRKLPEFSRWFGSKNIDLVLFSLSMTQLFRQSSATASLQKLMTHPDSRVCGSAIETLGAIEAFMMTDEIIRISKSYWKNGKVSIQIVHSLGKLAFNENHMQAIKTYCGHPSYAVRFEAVKAIKGISGDNGQFLEQFNEAEKNRLRGILSHLAEPLLQS